MRFKSLAEYIGELVKRGLPIVAFCHRPCAVGERLPIEGIPVIIVRPATSEEAANIQAAFCWKSTHPYPYVIRLDNSFGEHEQAYQDFVKEIESQVEEHV